MKTLRLADIIVPTDRQRTDIPDDHIGGLMESIFGPTGLINPITIRDGGTLVAGECRMRTVQLGYTLGKTLRHAGQDVPPGHIPVIDFGDLTLLQRMELEYEENARRKDLDWKENAAALAALDALRKIQAEARGETHTIKDTAQEVFGSSKGTLADTVSKAVTITKKIAAGNKELAAATSMREAVKILGKQEDTAQRERLAAVMGKTVSSERMNIIHGNCVHWMQQQPDGQFDVILTDPPYGMGADNFGDAAGRLAGTNHNYDDSAENFFSLMEACLPEFYRLAKPEAHLYIWCDIDWFGYLRDRCREIGWWIHRTPLINIKKEGGRVPWPEHGPRRSYELCLYAVKGKKPVTAIKPDVFESRLTEGNFGHGAQKPVEAYVELLSRSVRPGDRLFDAFAGTGTIFAAAHQMKCYAVGVEMEAAAYGTCVKRIGELK